MRSYLEVHVLLASLLAVTSCAEPPQQTASPTATFAAAPTGTGTVPGPKVEARLPILFDDDGSPDGTTALLYILSHPNADLRSASISYGETHPEIYIQHVGRMMDAVGFAGVPLGFGQDAPMAGTNGFPEGVRQFGNEFWGLPIPNAEKSYSAQPAPQLMVSIINGSPKPVTVFVSGPATNLAQALQRDPTIKGNIAAVYMMGGAVYAAGNLADLQPEGDNRVAEWNVYGDPQAARIAFESGIPFFLVPLDATDQVLVTRSEIGQWRAGGAVADFAADVYDQVLNFQGGDRGKIWDVMSAVIMLDPELCGFQRLHLEVITQDGSSSGQTAVRDGEPPNVSVCLTPDGAGIRQRLIDVFSGSASAVGPVATVPPSSQPRAPVTASAEMADAPAQNAVDGDHETVWNSGHDPEQWIMLDLGAPQAVHKLNLIVSQYPAGETVHQVWAGPDPDHLVLVREFRMLTTDRDALGFVPTSPLVDIRYVKVVTLQSPSWVAWREIEVNPE